MLLAIFEYDKPLESVFNPFSIWIWEVVLFCLYSTRGFKSCGGRAVHFVWSLIGKVNASQMHLA